MRSRGSVLERRRWLLPALLLIATVSSYLPALDAGFIWDDDGYVTANPLLRTGEGLWRIWSTTETPQYYPLVFTTFWIEYQLWELNPTGYHLVNILLHTLNAWLVWRLLSRLGAPAAVWAALLFAVHPVHVESVAWVTERKNVLSGMFYLLAFWSYLEFEARRRRTDYIRGLLLYLAALLSKTVTSSLPVALAIVLFYRNGRLTRADLRRLAPFLATGLGLGLITIKLERAMVGTVGLEFGFSVWDRLMLAGKTLWFYPARLLSPWATSFNYPRWELAAGGWLDWIPLAAVLAVCLAMPWLWRRGQRALVGLICFYGVTIAPAIGLVDVYPFRYSFVADHFQYLASLGGLILLAHLAHRGYLAMEARLGASGRRAAIGLAIALLLSLAVLSYRQATAYRDLPSLWVDTLNKNPDSWIAHHNLGLIELTEGKLDSAGEHLERSVAMRPESAEAHTAVGLLHARRGRPDEAFSAYSRAIELDSTYPQAYLNRGDLSYRRGRYERAIDDFSRVLEISPEFFTAYRTRGAARMALGRYQEALVDFDEALRLGAGFQAHNDRGVAFLQLGRYAEAVAEFDRALQQSPQVADILHNRALAHYRAGRSGDALADLNRVLALDAGAVKSWLLRGRLIASAGQLDRACSDWEQACRLGACELFEERCRP